MLRGKGRISWKTRETVQHVCELMGIAQESKDEVTGEGRATGAKKGWGPEHRRWRQPKEGGNSLSGMARGKAESKAARLL